MMKCTIVLARKSYVNLMNSTMLILIDCSDRSFFFVSKWSWIADEGGDAYP
jgi:hypothetical protein